MPAQALMLTSALALALVVGAPAPAQEMDFSRIASFPVALDTPDARKTSAEGIAASGDGMTLTCPDGPAAVIGFVDITDPANPVAAGAVVVPKGDPTTVSAPGQTHFMGENTSESFTNPSGVLHAVTIASRGFTAFRRDRTEVFDSGITVIHEIQQAPAIFPHPTSAGTDSLTGWGAIPGQVMAGDGTMWVSTDNDGVSDQSGETMFFAISPM